MNKIIFPLIVIILLSLESCRTAKNVESSSMAANSKDSLSESYEDEQIDITIEYPSFHDTTPPQATAPKASKSDNSNPAGNRNNRKKPEIRIGNSLFPILPKSKITISKSSIRTKKDSVHNNNIVKDDKSVKPKEDNREMRQYGAILAFFILFYCLVVSLRKKTP